MGSVKICLSHKPALALKIINNAIWAHFFYCDNIKNEFSGDRNLKMLHIYFKINIYMPAHNNIFFYYSPINFTDTLYLTNSKTKNCLCQYCERLLKYSLTPKLVCKEISIRCLTNSF